MCDFVSFFFFKQKTAYEMRISDWSSDVCSSDLILFFKTSMDPPAIIQPRVRRTQYSTKASWLNPMPPMICIASFETSHPARLQASFAMAEIGRASCRERVCQYV